MEGAVGVESAAIGGISFDYTFKIRSFSISTANPFLHQG